MFQYSSLSLLFENLKQKKSEDDDVDYFSDMGLGAT